MALQSRQRSDDLVIIAGAIVVGLSLAGGINAVVTWLLNRHARQQAGPGDVFDAAPWDDEPLSAAELAQIAASEAEIARGEVVPWSEVAAGRRVTA